MNKIVTVTGSSGFVGSNLIKNFSEYTIREADLLSTDLSAISFSDSDCVVHLAALVHQMKGAPKEKYFEINRDMAFEVAKKAKNQGVKLFIFMSTAKVFGENTTGTSAWDESTKCHPIDPYGESKLQAERLLQKLQDKYFRVAIIRSPIIYGPGVKANMYNLIKLLDKFPIVPLGGIQNKRSLVYIGNLIALTKQIINTSSSGIFIAGDPESISISTLSLLIANNLHKRIVLLRIPKTFSSVLKCIKPSLVARIWGSLELNTSISNKKLGFTPPFTIELGIHEMVKWYLEDKHINHK